MWRNENLTYYWGECKIVEALYKQLLMMFIRLPYNPEISLLGMYIKFMHSPEISLLRMYIKEMKTYIHKKNYAEMLSAVLFIITKKKPKTKKLETTQMFIR